MNESLKEIIKKAQCGDRDSKMKIVDKFKPLIKKYSRKLKYEDASTDLIIKLLEVINSMPILDNRKIKEDKQIVGYICYAIKNEYIKLSKKRYLIANNEVFWDEYIAPASEINIDDCILINNLLDRLPDKQRKILEYKFMKDYSDVQIANQFNISRQAVNKTKNKALKNLKLYLGEECIAVM